LLYKMIFSNKFEGQGKSTYPLSANATVLSITPRLLVTR
jgi:hypothetical protein